MNPSHLQLQGTTAGAVVPLFRCRKCKRPAVRYLGGKRRSWYCEEHGPVKLSDWTRLLPIPVQEYEIAGRTLSTAPPLPAKVARLLDGLSDGLREVLAQDFPATRMEDGARVTALEQENVRLRKEVERLTYELAVAEEIASEALELRPTPASATAGAVVEEAAIAVPSAPMRKGKGFKLEPPPPTLNLLQVARDTIAPVPPITEARAKDDPALDVFSLEVLIQRVPHGPKSPGLTATRYAMKDFDHLSTRNKRDVLDALAILSGEHPEVLREERVYNSDPPLYALRANRRLRIICGKEGHTYHITRIVDRSDKSYFRSER